jgi:transcriptional regulator with XRE-family HTH domain
MLCKIYNYGGVDMRKNLRFKALLFQRGITERELGEQVSLPRTYISMAVNGRLRLGKDEQEKIASVLRVPVSAIFRKNEMGGLR